MSEAVVRKAKALPVMAVKASKASGLTHEMRTYSELLQKTLEDEAQLSALRQKVHNLEKSLAERDAQHAETLAQAVEDSRKEAIASVTKDNDVIVKALTDNLMEARKSFETFLTETEALAVELVSVALGSLFSNPEMTKNTLAGMIGKAVDDLGQKAILSLRVSRDDFADLDALLEHQPDLKTTDFTVEIDPVLPQGTCVFDLLVGTYELSLSDHWNTLRRFLETVTLEATSQQKSGVTS